MCGIAGAYTVFTPTSAQPLIDRLHHRGPDGEGLVNVLAGSLGHTRLAILDVEGGHQPMNYDQLTISFNGEVYNHLDLHRHLKGEPLQTRTDTEVVLRLYAQCGPACVEQLDGMFAFAILSQDALFLARDPLGIKPLYYGVGSEGVMYFASEIKALSRVTDDINEFPPGCWYHSRLGWQQYYGVPGVAETDSPTRTNQRDVLPTIRETLRQAVHKRLMADVPVGVSLSGGLDSSIITLLAREGVEGLHSFGVGVEGSEDLAAAQQVACFLGTHHHEFVYTEQDIEEALPDILYYLESFDPALVRSAIPNYFLARLAAEHVKVMLTGEGADELYAGYAYLSDFTEPALLQEELVGITAALHNSNLQRTDRMSMAHGLEARVPFLDVQSVALVLGLPAVWKVHTPAQPPKALLRQAFAAQLPVEIINRPKQKFAQGAGSADLLAQRAEESISDDAFVAERQRLQNDWHYQLPNKEALYYYRRLREFYRDEWILPGMGRSRSL
jgi:asparagine synthase (glutamine-hydrolysing)